MYFSDAIKLLKESHQKNELNQYETVTVKKEVFADLKGISSRELADAGTAGHKAEGIAEVHIDDYNGEELVEITEPHPILKEGIYAVYRKFIKTDTIELYLEERVGLWN